MRVCWALYDVAAPIHWRSINLRKSYAYTPEDFLDTFSPRTRSFIRSVTAKAYTWVTVTPDECATFAQIILALPNVEAMPVIISDVYQQGSPGVAMYEELAATVYGKLSSLDFTIVEAEKVGWREKRQVPPNLDLSAARTIFAYLDPTRLRRLALVGEISMPAMFSDILCQFVRLEQFSLRAARLDLAPFFAALATIPARLRSLEVQVVLGPVAQASALLPMLAAFGPSLEHLTLTRLSSRRVSDPPLEILDLGTQFFGGFDESNVSLLDLMLSLRDTLEVVMVDDEIFDDPAFRRDLSAAIELRWTHDIWFLFPGEAAKKTGGIGVISDEVRYSRWVHDEEEEDEMW